MIFWRREQSELNQEIAEKNRVLNYIAGFIDGQRSAMRAVGIDNKKLPAPFDLELRVLAIRHG